jgi:hypothetical protein
MDQPAFRKLLENQKWNRGRAGIGVLRALPGAAVVSSEPGKKCPELVAEFSLQGAAEYFVRLDQEIVPALEKSVQAYDHAAHAVVALLAPLVGAETEHLRQTVGAAINLLEGARRG